ncbi:hypothetical protein GPY37_22940 [Photorhabdus kayaii]|uniref:Uncharacterized protein n=1 Tax=Photorhabdus kayaii TaxID=230088 RepID=A0ABX0B1T9_9GAMM|nr:hypothetical protein [Photorhabdus bodei]MCC8464337.1 hypothetical protein [Photorhabdus bodei]NDL14423.1 hypothetical protein [Photorhabdus kayaii]NDL27077.1 hypothetical protein [Photorhabdus kayaii]
MGTYLYPVPNPDFPFLGVHFTRMFNGKRDVGPNAVLAIEIGREIVRRYFPTF